MKYLYEQQIDHFATKKRPVRVDGQRDTALTNA